MRKNFTLILVLLFLAADWAVLEATRTEIPAADYEEKLAAAALAQECMELVRERRRELGVPINSGTDINGTGLIGPDYSAITTTLGSLEAKRTSTNPNMAAVVVDMLHELGLQRGDRVAINCSGSFPALNICVLCAVQTLGLEPLQMSSFGSSTHGANDPDFTYLDMEHLLWEAGLLTVRSDYFSAGGMEDLGREMDAGVRGAVTERLEGYGYALFEDEELLRNIRRRYEWYNAGGEVKCFINVGGNDVSFGDSNVIVHADGGILTELSERDGSTGLVQLFLRDGTPVIHLLNIKSIAAQYDLPFDPSPAPTPGEGGPFRVRSYRWEIAAAGLALAGLTLAAGFRGERKQRPPER